MFISCFNQIFPACYYSLLLWSLFFNDMQCITLYYLHTQMQFFSIFHSLAFPSLVSWYFCHTDQLIISCSFSLLISLSLSRSYSPSSWLPACIQTHTHTHTHTYTCDHACVICTLIYRSNFRIWGKTCPLTFCAWPTLLNMMFSSPSIYLPTMQFRLSFSCIKLHSAYIPYFPNSVITCGAYVLFPRLGYYEKCYKQCGCANNSVISWLMLPWVYPQQWYTVVHRIIWLFNF
jgi:hypothetical protein